MVLRAPEDYTAASAAAGLGGVRYWVELALATGIATLGLLQNSPGAVFAAMLLSPWRGPVMAAALGLAAGEAVLALRAALKILMSVAATVLLAAGLAWMLPFRAATPEILARTAPTLLDLAIAVA